MRTGSGTGCFVPEWQLVWKQFVQEQMGMETGFTGTVGDRFQVHKNRWAGDNHLSLYEKRL